MVLIPVNLKNSSPNNKYTKIKLFASTGSAWGVTTAFSYWGASIYQFFGGHPENWFYFQQKANAEGIAGGFLN